MRVLVILAHPKPSGSVVQAAMLKAIKGLDHVRIHDLLAHYPDFGIDVAAEQKLLLEHDLIVLQHPFYWYSAPAIIKEWQDLVLEQGWAYGTGGTRLAGKFLMSAISTGGSAEAYSHQGRNRFTMEELLSPFDQTAYLCSMAYLEPFVIHAGRRLSESELTADAEAYRDLIVGLRDRKIEPLSRLIAGYTLPPAFQARAA